MKCIAADILKLRVGLVNDATHDCHPTAESEGNAAITLM